ncbi:Daunorubicin/doxorubicin resistance ATP-binding protein DrrA [uncultured Clostridium sp.]|uniref:ABC transporter ATP-binding protein n=1 Tax=uncultured Clostridium sp. TaxID=59620 RepID=UPI000820CC46|nr:ABC transporter ATP-binding protein [uncultured Clostridium sp.]SCK03010.1 Daunorubicin/doxorubicin resistance ATP-binding protein DrrA [uncultured Clostridium sp.]
MSIVNVLNLKKQYGENLALDDVTLSINEGDIYGILGPNGSGKSTFINILSGLLSFDDGVCRIFNKDIKKYKTIIRREISVVTQEYSIYNDLKAIENVELFARLSGLKNNNIKNKVNEALERVNLTNNSNNYPNTFSGGMKRRLNIACAIVNNPKLLIMDEPTASLDPISREFIIKTIKEINLTGTTILYTSHYLDEVERICNKLTILNRGKILITDKTKKVIDKYKNRNVIIAYLNNVPNNFIRKIKEILILRDEYTITKYDMNLFELKIFCDNTGVILQRLIKATETYKIYIKDIDIRESSLEEVFFKLVK